MLVQKDKLNLIIRRLKSQGFFNLAIRYFRKWRYKRAGLPTYIQIEPASICNLRCPYCVAFQTTDSVESGVMPLNDFKKLIDSIASRKGYYPPIDLFYRGEPMMNRNFSEMVRYAASKKLTIGVNTNATLLNNKNRAALLGSGLDVMLISFDGATKKSYEEHRVGADFDDVVAKIRSFCQERNNLGLSKPLIDLQFIVTKKNEHELPLIKSLAAEMGVDHLSLKTLRIPLMDRPIKEAIEQGKTYLPDSKKYRRYKEIRGINNEITAYEPINPTVTCNWSNGAAIRYDGELGLCCNDYSDTFSIGNVIVNDFWDIWWSDVYTDLRKKIGQRILSICKTCD